MVNELPTTSSAVLAKIKTPDSEKSPHQRQLNSRLSRWEPAAASRDTHAHHRPQPSKYRDFPVHETETGGNPGLVRPPTAGAPAVAIQRRPTSSERKNSHESLPRYSHKRKSARRPAERRGQDA